MHNKTAAESRQEVQHSFQLTAPPATVKLLGLLQLCTWEIFTIKTALQSNAVK